MDLFWESLPYDYILLLAIRLPDEQSPKLEPDFYRECYPCFFSYVFFYKDIHGQTVSVKRIKCKTVLLGQVEIERVGFLVVVKQKGFRKYEQIQLL